MTETIRNHAVPRPLPAGQYAYGAVPSSAPSSANRLALLRLNGKSMLAKAVRALAYAIAGFMAFMVVMTILYRFVNPPISSLMLQQRLSGVEIHQKWVALENISPLAIRAVMLSEDGRFCSHYGIDFVELQYAIERSIKRGGIPRGASTISMQVVKNLFLWPSKSYFRKAFEVPITVFMELVMSKPRIMEIYLNIAEWAPGIFGIEAAANHYFGKSARSLTMNEAARLAVVLPNPFVRNAGRPGPRTWRLSRLARRRVYKTPDEFLDCVLPGQNHAIRSK